jgi:tRNA modification GTPase
MKTTLPESVTWAACLTPPGTAAIATLTLRGPQAWEIVRELFQPWSARQPLPAEAEIGRIWLGRLGVEWADEVVLTVKRTAPAPWVEIHCHGGREVIRLLLETFAARGCQVCSWQNLERQTAEDPWRAEAAIALAEARTTRTAAILLDQYQGAFGRAIAAVLAASERADTAEAQRLLAELVRYTGVGRHLTVPWRVVVAGAPNVGKSSLVNALAGYQRSVVSATPGTTRDVVTLLTAFDGWPVELADTAGWRTGGAALEEQGIVLAKVVAAEADLCLWVLDAAAPPVWPALASDKLRFVVNKMDLPPVWDVKQAAGAVPVSAQTGSGIGELCQALAAWLVPAPPPPGVAVPFTPLLCDQVEEAQRQAEADSAVWARNPFTSLINSLRSPVA